MDPAAERNADPHALSDCARDELRRLRKRTAQLRIDRVNFLEAVTRFSLHGGA